MIHSFFTSLCSSHGETFSHKGKEESGERRGGAGEGVIYNISVRESAHATAAAAASPHPSFGSTSDLGETRMKVYPMLVVRCPTRFLLKAFSIPCLRFGEIFVPMRYRTSRVSFISNHSRITCPPSSRILLNRKDRVFTEGGIFSKIYSKIVKVLGSEVKKHVSRFTTDGCFFSKISTMSVSRLLGIASAAGRGERLD